MHKTTFSFLLASLAASLLALSSGAAQARACGAELQAMEDAADLAMAACSGPDTQETLARCNFAWGYFEAKASAYDECMRYENQNPQG